MHGNLMYELARQRVAEQRQAAKHAADAARDRAAVRGRHAKRAELDAAALPVMPDFADDLLEVADAVPAPREEVGRGHHAQSGR
jgi:hypothetical protein